MSKEDQEVQKLVLCMCYCDIACFMCCLMSNVIEEDPNIYMVIFKVERFSHV